MQTKLFGLTLKSPIVIGSGPLTYGAEGMIRLHNAGAGAVVTKTIRMAAAVNANPHMLLSGRDSLINCEKWADFPATQWIEREIPQAKKAGVTVIASIGMSTGEVSELCAPIASAGADIIEVVSYDHNDIPDMVRAARAKTKLPILAKLPPLACDVVKVAGDCLAAGADGITGFDSFGQVLRIEVTTGRPLLGGVKGAGWLSGAAIKPLVLYKISELRKAYSCPIIGLGGVTSAEDALEMLMAGASVVGMCSAVILRGPEMLTPLLKQMGQLMEKYNYSSLEELCGLSLSYLDAKENVRKLSFTYNEHNCTNCRRCVVVCPYQARELSQDKVMRLNQDKCRYCGLCGSVCAAKALTYRRI